jgi:tRNA(Ile)-lysidine synthase
MSLQEEFIRNIQQQNLFQKTDELLLAVSGGADSVALCELCFRAGFYFEIAHCNFQLRGDESERDEKFVQELAAKYHSQIFVKKFDTKDYAERNKVSIQVAARELRYSWFNELLEDAQSGNEGSASPRCYLVTAHHANDNVETLLMNFFKGTGIKGLQAIQPKQNKIIRPLLFAKKEEILSFIKENNLSFVEDSSNASDKYTRNYFRHQLIPSIQKVFPQVEENLLKNIERFREIEMLFQESVEHHKKNLIEKKGNEIHIPVLKLLKLQACNTVVYEIIKEYGFTSHQVKEVLNLLESESGKYISSSSHKIIRNRRWLIIAPVQTLEASNILIQKDDKEIDFEGGKLKIKIEENRDVPPSSSPNIATLDSSEIEFPLLLRRWKQGDYFYPLGMKKKKKLSKFFIDEKLSLTEKGKIWIIESNRKIIWVVGKRIDDRFRVTSKSKKLLLIHLVSGENMS